MIHESFPWKQDLHRRKRLIKKYNTKEQFEKNSDAAYTVIEKGIFYSAFIIRKLADCKTKLSDKADKYTLQVRAIKPLIHINALNRWPDEESHDWDNETLLTIQGKDICNWLIHSYIFFTEKDDNSSAPVGSFYVSSDYDRNKYLYRISIGDWLNYMEFIATDYIVAMGSRYDETKSDYICMYKTRG